MNRTNILTEVDLEVFIDPVTCDSDEVLTKFIEYYSDSTHNLGVLGPPCSNTIESIAGKYHLFFFFFQLFLVFCLFVIFVVVATIVVELFFRLLT